MLTLEIALILKVYTWFGCSPLIVNSRLPLGCTMIGDWTEGLSGTGEYSTWKWVRSPPPDCQRMVMELAVVIGCPLPTGGRGTEMKENKKHDNY